MSDNSRVPRNRIERVLTFVIASTLGLSVLAIIAVIVAGLARIDTSGAGVWLTVKILPLIALPLALVALVVFLIVSTAHRRRIASGGER